MKCNGIQMTHHNGADRMLFILKQNRQETHDARLQLFRNKLVNRQTTMGNIA